MTEAVILEHLLMIQYLICTFAASLFMVAALASPIRWWTRLVMGLNMLFWAYNAIEIKYPWIIDAYLETFAKV